MARQTATPSNRQERRRFRTPLDTDRVPVLPPGATYLMQALNDDDLGFREIAAAVEKMPSIAARILALANSAWSAPVRPILALDEACGRLGIRVVRSTSIAIAVSQPFNPARCPAFDARTFWQTSLMNADAADWLAQITVPEKQSIARTAGLLSNLGLVWLAEALPRQTAEALISSTDQPPGTVERALVRYCGVGYVEAGALLADAWKLPMELRCAIAHQIEPDPGDDILAIVISAATRMVGRVRRSHETDIFEPGLVKLGIDDDAQKAIFERLDQSGARTAELAEALFAG